MTAFLTFGDSRFEHSLQRIEREADSSGFFDRTRVVRPADLGGAFWRKHGRFVSDNRRGYGYWIWKPWITLEALLACAPGDTLVYADAGCTINGKGRERYEEYLRLLRSSETGVLGFETPSPEKRYTKGDVFSALDAWHLRDTPQIIATVTLWRRCPESVAFAREWLALAERYELIADAPCRTSNDPAFETHRRDQSLFSLLAKLRGATVIDDETAFENWKDATEYPFWATRKRGRRQGPLHRIRRSLEVRWLRTRYGLVSSSVCALSETVPNACLFDHA